MTWGNRSRVKKVAHTAYSLGQCLQVECNRTVGIDDIGEHELMDDALLILVAAMERPDWQCIVVKIVRSMWNPTNLVPLQA